MRARITSGERIKGDLDGPAKPDPKPVKVKKGKGK